MTQHPDTRSVQMREAREEMYQSLQKEVSKVFAELLLHAGILGAAIGFLALGVHEAQQGRNMIAVLELAMGLSLADLDMLAMWRSPDLQVFSDLVKERNIAQAQL